MGRIRKSNSLQPLEGNVSFIFFLFFQILFLMFEQTFLSRKRPELKNQYFEKTF